MPIHLYAAILMHPSPYLYYSHAALKSMSNSRPDLERMFMFTDNTSSG